MELYLATTNQHKVKELQALVFQAGLDIGVHTPEALGDMGEVAETEDTFEGNARLKAQALQRIAPEDTWILADDSGICVEALKGAPGVFSSRYAGAEASDQDNYMKLLRDMEHVPEEERTAHFLCCFVLLNKSVGEVVFQAMLKGRIAREASGAEGFGYDPVFIPNGYDRTIADLGQEIKNQISHRSLATEQLINWLKNF